MWGPVLELGWGVSALRGKIEDMDVNLPEWLGVIGAVLSIALALGAALALVKGSYNKARIEALRQDNTDLRSRVDDLAREVERRAVKESELDAQVAHLSTENQMLADMILQRANVEALTDLLQNHHEEAMQHWRQMGAVLTKLAEEKR